MRELGPAEKTMRCFQRAGSVDELLAKAATASRPSWMTSSPTCIQVA